jgi:hypothetical protein
MNEAESKLWSLINAFELDDDTSSLTFSDRLARENEWSKEFALRAIEEYKKFMFLICTINLPLTPSDEVDQVWHLHLLYTQSYWKEFCARILKREVHHGPTKGGTQENNKFSDWYSKTLLYYKEKFKLDPPIDLWPPKEIRFRQSDFKRVDLLTNWIIKNPFK